MTFLISQGTMATAYRGGGQIHDLYVKFRDAVYTELQRKKSMPGDWMSCKAAASLATLIQSMSTHVDTGWAT